MSIENWSDDIVVVDLQDDPGFTDDLTVLTDQVGSDRSVDLVVNFANVNYLNSSNIARLLKLRKLVITNNRRLVLCGIDTNVWGLFLVTGLDKVFEFADNVATALTTVQLAAE